MYPILHLQALKGVEIPGQKWWKEESKLRLLGGHGGDL